MTAAIAESEVPAFTAQEDDWIVKWFLKDRKVILRRLENRGYRRDAILDRARELGLSEQFLKRCAVGNPDVALRACLGCGQRFLSVGIQNRLCRRCKDRG